MKRLSKMAAIFTALIMAFAFVGCKQSTNNDDGNSRSKLNAPTNLVINSMKDNTVSCAVNISFKYNGKVGLDGAKYAILGYSLTNDSSQAVYDYNTHVHVEAGENTRTANIPSTDVPYFKPVSGTKYYFWLKVVSAANNVSDSAWSNVAEFTY